MSFMPPEHGHLDATTGRAVVYCHICGNEWYQDENGLQCPRCESEAAEIVTPENDPRGFRDAGPGPEQPGFGQFHSPYPDIHHADSDPDEADIDDHVHSGPGNFYTRQTIFRSPSRPRDGTPRPNDRGPVDPANGDQVWRRFHDMLMNDFQLGGHQAGRSGPNQLFPNEQGPPQGVFFSGPTRTVRTVMSPVPGGGVASFTIATGTMPRAGGPGGAADFDTVFGNLMGHVGPPQQRNDGEEGAPGFPPGLPASLHAILTTLLNPAAAVSGDAVYSQEALDRIISQLMEQNPSSNAAPPATESALASLERKAVDDQMLGQDAKVDCSICIEEIKKGDEVIVLPCKHWYHPDCVVLWLKEHNTCPICRAPIEKNGSRDNANASNQGAQQQQQPPRQQPPQQQPPHMQHFGQFNYHSPAPPNPPRHERTLRSARENEERLNAIRNIGGVGSSADSRPSPAHRQSGNRRSSMSPPSPRAQSANDYGFRIARVRSPSASRDRNLSEDTHGQESNRRDGHGSGSGSGNGGGPLSWLRGQFSRNNNGGGASGSGSGYSSGSERRRS